MNCKPTTTCGKPLERSCQRSSRSSGPREISLTAISQGHSKLIEDCFNGSFIFV
jgi:hypothetical protein